MTFRQSQLTVDEVVKHYDIFIACLKYLFLHNYKDKKTESLMIWFQSLEKARVSRVKEREEKEKMKEGNGTEKDKEKDEKEEGKKEKQKDEIDIEKLVREEDPTKFYEDLDFVASGCVLNFFRLIVTSF